MSKVTIPPIFLDVDGAKVTILEITSRKWVDGSTHYIVSCQVEYGSYKSPIFQLDVKSNDELMAKLKVEVSKLKLMSYAGIIKTK